MPDKLLKKSQNIVNFKPREKNASFLTEDYEIYHSIYDYDEFSGNNDENNVSCVTIKNSEA